MRKIVFTFLLLVYINCLGFSQKIGDRVQVLWNGSYYSATVTEAKETVWKVHYNGYDDTWDEWVNGDRIKSALKKGDKIEVLWNDAWYNAEVIAVNGCIYKVHYDGYEKEWDEWITPHRLKK